MMTNKKPKTLKTTRRISGSEEVEIFEKRWCAFGKHWLAHKRFYSTGSYCKQCVRIYEQLKRLRVKLSEIALKPLLKELRVTQQILFDVIGCSHCQSRGYIINHENKLFMCDCRRKARMQIEKLKEKK